MTASQESSILPNKTILHQFVLQSTLLENYIKLYPACQNKLRLPLKGNTEEWGEGGRVVWKKKKKNICLYRLVRGLRKRRLFILIFKYLYAFVAKS